MATDKAGSSRGDSCYLLALKQIKMKKIYFSDHLFCPRRGYRTHALVLLNRTFTRQATKLLVSLVRKNYKYKLINVSFRRFVVM